MDVNNPLEMVLIGIDPYPTGYTMVWPYFRKPLSVERLRSLREDIEMYHASLNEKFHLF